MALKPVPLRGEPWLFIGWRGMLTDGVDENDGQDGEGGEDDEEDFEVLLELATKVNGIKTALLETGSAVSMMMMVMMMFGH